MEPRAPFSRNPTRLVSCRAPGPRGFCAQPWASCFPGAGENLRGVSRDALRVLFLPKEPIRGYPNIRTRVVLSCPCQKARPALGKAAVSVEKILGPNFSPYWEPKAPPQGRGEKVAPLVEEKAFGIPCQIGTKLWVGLENVFWGNASEDASLWIRCKPGRRWDGKAIPPGDREVWTQPRRRVYHFQKGLGEVRSVEDKRVVNF